MKKWLLSLLTVVYLATFSGVAMDIHYCMGKKTGADIFAKKNDKCSRCGMKDKKGCCNDEHRFYKLSGDHNNVTNEHSFEQLVTDHQAINLIAPLVFEQAQIPLSPAFPADDGPPLYISYCVFRI